MKWPAARMASQTSKGFGIYAEAAALARRGVDVIHLEFGRPSFDTPIGIKEASKRALDDGIVHYGDLAGSRTLRIAIAADVASRKGLPAGPDDVLITNGLTQASFASFVAGVDPGDEVLFLEPYYPQHLPKVELFGGRPVLVPLDKSAGWAIDPERLEAAVTPKTTMLVLVNPANPVGRVFSLGELEAVAELAMRHDLLVVTDEVYERITYDGRSHIAIGSLPDMWERTISLYAFTKAFAMDGWRLGYAVAPRRFIEQMLKVTMNETTHANVFAQEGALAAIRDFPHTAGEMVEEDRRRRDLVVGRFNAIGRVSCPEPEGTIYAFPDFSDFAANSDELARRILHETHVAMESGRFYGPQGQGHLRLCFGSEPIERVGEALDRVEQWLDRQDS